MDGLGNLYDIVIGCVPTDVVAGAITGKRVHLKNYAGMDVVLIAVDGSTDIMDVDVQQHTASSSGTTADLDVVTRYYLKDATALASSTLWAEVTQAAASEITNIGSASKQQIAVIPVEAASLTDGYEWVSVDLPDAGTNGTKFVAMIYVMRGLRYPRNPVNLPSPLA